MVVTLVGVIRSRDSLSIEQHAQLGLTSANSGNPCSCHSIAEVTYRSVDGCSVPADGCRLYVVFSRLWVDYCRSAQLYGHYSDYGNYGDYGNITHHNGEHSTFQRAHNLLP